MTCPLVITRAVVDDRLVPLCRDHLAGQLLAGHVVLPDAGLGLQLLPQAICVECELEAWLAGDDDAARAQYAPHLRHDHAACLGRDHFAALAHPAGPCLMGCGLCAAY